MILTRWRNSAHDSAVSTTWPQKPHNEDEESGPEGLPAEEGRLCEGVYDNTEEAELGIKEGRKGKADKRYGSYSVYPGCGT